MQVTVDDRESGAGVIEHLQAMPDVRVVTERLQTGDYLVDHRMLFERKTVGDFAVSVVDGRLFRQARRLANSSFRVAVILEGTEQAAAAMGVRREAMQGAIISLTMSFGVPLLRALDQVETARLILYAGAQAQRSAGGGCFRPGYRPKGREARQVYILSGLPGIGPERARRLLEEFGSVEGVITADAEELAEVEGVGRKTAEAIRGAVS